MIYRSYYTLDTLFKNLSKIQLGIHNLLLKKFLHNFYSIHNLSKNLCQIYMHYKNLGGYKFHIFFSKLKQNIHHLNLNKFHLDSHNFILLPLLQHKQYINLLLIYIHHKDMHIFCILQVCSKNIQQDTHTLLYLNFLQNCYSNYNHLMGLFHLCRKCMLQEYHRFYILINKLKFHNHHYY